MKIYVLKVVSAGPMSWYSRHIGEEFFAEWSGPEGMEFHAIRHLSDPTYIGGSYFDSKHVEVVRHFEGHVVPTNTVDIKEY